MSLTERLDGCTILIVEPDPFISSYIAAALASVGARAIGLDANAEVMFAQSTFHATVLGLDKPRGDPWLMAAGMEERAVPLMLISSDWAEVPARFAHLPHLRRPFASFQVLEILVSLIGRAAASTATFPLPCAP